MSLGKTQRQQIFLSKLENVLILQNIRQEEKTQHDFIQSYLLLLIQCSLKTIFLGFH